MGSKGSEFTVLGHRGRFHDWKGKLTLQSRSYVMEKFNPVEHLDSGTADD